jgi:hypothetical protein
MFQIVGVELYKNKVELRGLHNLMGLRMHVSVITWRRAAVSAIATAYSSPSELMSVI